MSRFLKLCREINSLHKKASRLNLYVSMLNNKNTIDLERVKNEIRTAKTVILNIENEIHDL